MIKYNTLNHLEPNIHRYKIKQSGPIPNQIRTQFMDENSTHERLDMIRKKYTSKQKDRNTLSLKKDDPMRDKDYRRQALKQKLNERTRSQFHLTDYNYTNQYQYQSQYDLHKKQSTSKALDGMKQRYERSKEKVCERVENIKKINDKIKNILNRFENKVQTNPKYSIAKRPSLTEQKKDNNYSLKAKKLQLYQNQFRSKQLVGLSNIQEGILFTSRIPESHPIYSLPSKSIEDKIQQTFPFKNINTTTVHVSQNQSLNMTIDQSFVIQKYNPSVHKQSNLYINPKYHPNSQLLQLVSKICGQIEHDQQFRTSKYFFLLNLQQNKYQKLQKQFQKKGFVYSLDQLTQMMRFAEEQYDPFMFQTAHEDYNKYTQSFIKANQYWKENIFQKYNYNKLVKEGIEQTLTIDNKQELSVSDLVRFSNLTSGKMYKNRDLMVILRRIGEKNVRLQQVYKTFCYNYQ